MPDPVDKIRDKELSIHGLCMPRIHSQIRENTDITKHICEEKWIKYFQGR